jgi:hypothetical protein
MKWIGQHIWSLVSRFRSDVYLENISSTTETNIVVVDSNGKVSFNNTGTDSNGDNILDKHHTHDQSVSSNQWTVTHNLNKYPSVQVIDSAGSFCIGQITHNSVNQLTLDFNASFTGKAYLN